MLTGDVSLSASCQRLNGPECICCIRCLIEGLIASEFTVKTAWTFDLSSHPRSELLKISRKMNPGMSNLLWLTSAKCTVKELHAIIADHELSFYSQYVLLTLLLSIYENTICTLAGCAVLLICRVKRGGGRDGFLSSSDCPFLSLFFPSLSMLIFVFKAAEENSLSGGILSLCGQPDRLRWWG